MNDKRYRVYNKAKYDVGVRLVNGLSANIQAGTFQLMSEDDIMFIESYGAGNSLFARRILVPCDDNNVELDIQSFGLSVNEETKILTDDEIKAALKLSVSKFSAWLDGIQDDAVMHSVYMYASKQDDLPMNKLKILNAKMPKKNWLDEEDDEEE